MKLPQTFRRFGAALFFVACIGTQGVFVVRAYEHPHNLFVYQPFPQSSTWDAQIVRVLPDGRRVSIENGWAGYRWEHMVRGRGLSHPFVHHRAHNGIESTVAFLQNALDWVALHTPRDDETVRFEATVHAVRNGHRHERYELTSVERNPGAEVAR